MTIATEKAKERYAGNGFTVDFDYEFKINLATDLLVTVADDNDEATELVLNTHYTVSGVGLSAGGVVTLLDLTAICDETKLPEDWTVTIIRSIAIKQETDLSAQDGFSAQTHENVFDYLTMIAQQQQEELDRTIKVSSTSGLNGEGFTTDLDNAVNAARASEAAAATSESNADISEANAMIAEENAETAQAAAAVSEGNAEDSATEAAASAAKMPSSLTGQAGKHLEVNSGETAYEYVSPSANLVGEMKEYCSSAVPTNFLSCNGETIGDVGSGADHESALYEALFDLLKPSWGNAGTEVFGDGDTILLPDRRGTFSRGAGAHGSLTMANANPYEGPAVGESEGDQNLAHTHSYYHFHDSGADPNYAADAGDDVGRMLGYTTGSNGGDESRPVNYGVHFIIAYQ